MQTDPSPNHIGKYELEAVLTFSQVKDKFPTSFKRKFL